MLTVHWSVTTKNRFVLFLEPGISLYLLVVHVWMSHLRSAISCSLVCNVNALVCSLVCNVNALVCSLVCNVNALVCSLVCNVNVLVCTVWCVM